MVVDAEVIGRLAVVNAEEVVTEGVLSGRREPANRLVVGERFCRTLVAGLGLEELQPFEEDLFADVGLGQFGQIGFLDGATAGLEREQLTVEAIPKRRAGRLVCRSPRADPAIAIDRGDPTRRRAA